MFVISDRLLQLSNARLNQGLASQGDTDFFFFGLEFGINLHKLRHIQ